MKNSNEQQKAIEKEASLKELEEDIKKLKKPKKVKFTEAKLEEWLEKQKQLNTSKAGTTIILNGSVVLPMPLAE